MMGMGFHAGPAGVPLKHRSSVRVGKTSSQVCTAARVYAHVLTCACVFVGWPRLEEHYSSCAHLASIKVAATLRNVLDPHINSRSVDGTARTDTHTKHYARPRFWGGHKLINHSRISLQLAVWSPQKCGILSVLNLNKNISWKNTNV